MSVFLVQHGKILLIKVVITRIIASSTAGASAQLELVLEAVLVLDNKCECKIGDLVEYRTNTNTDDGKYATKWPMP